VPLLGDVLHYHLPGPSILNLSGSSELFSFLEHVGRKTVCIRTAPGVLNPHFSPAIYGEAVYKLNSPPRKCLGYKTTYEAFEKAAVMDMKKIGLYTYHLNLGCF